MDRFCCRNRFGVTLGLLRFASQFIAGQVALSPVPTPLLRFAEAAIARIRAAELIADKFRARIPQSDCWRRPRRYAPRANDVRFVKPSFQAQLPASTAVSHTSAGDCRRRHILSR